MSSNDSPSISDLYGMLGFILNPDGSITRIPDFYPNTPPSSDPANPVLTKDIPINQQTNTWARLYLPRPQSDTIPTTKLTLIVYFHGSGFVVTSAATTAFQKFLWGVVLETPAVVVSVDYRLAPENRLPAAYDDSWEALHWLKNTNEEWLTKYADFSRCFIMGTSAGGNIVYDMGLRAVTSIDQLMPLKIQGLVLQDAFFGGVERTPSEIRHVDDQEFPLALIDLMWDLSLPIGANRDHEYCNPMKDPEFELLDKVKKQGWRFLVTGHEGDPLVDRQIQLAKMLRDMGVDVTDKFSDGGYHAIETVDDTAAQIYYGVLKNFILAA